MPDASRGRPHEATQFGNPGAPSRERRQARLRERAAAQANFISVQSALSANGTAHAHAWHRSLYVDEDTRSNSRRGKQTKRAGQSSEGSHAASASQSKCVSACPNRKRTRPTKRRRSVDAGLQADLGATPVAPLRVVTAQHRARERGEPLARAQGLTGQAWEAEASEEAIGGGGGRGSACRPRHTRPPHPLVADIRRGRRPQARERGAPREPPNPLQRPEVPRAGRGREGGRGGAYRMVLPVRMRIHCGIGRFCFSFLARVFLVRIVLLAGCAEVHTRRNRM